MYNKTLKVSEQTYNYIKKDFERLLDSLDMGKKLQFTEYRNENPVRLAWHFWHERTAQKRFDDSHPGWKDRERILEYDPDTELYPDGTNDKTLETAIIRIIKEL